MGLQRDAESAHQPKVQRAIVLLVHGSPDADWMQPFERIVARALEIEPDVLVRVATLAREPTLRSCVATFHASGHRHVEIASGLLSSGGRHHKDDLPELVKDLRRDFPDIAFELRPGALGDHLVVVDAIARVILEVVP